MARWWLAVGLPGHWEVAFKNGNIWGLRESLKAHWESLSNGDGILFYATDPVKGVIGHGVIRSKFKQDKPLWPQEVRENRVIWPYRFEFDVAYCLPREAWESRRLTSEKLMPRIGFQPISEELAVQIVSGFPGGMKPGKEESIHESIKAKLVEIGRIQKMIAESEYDMDGGKLDVVWRRVERGVPTYVFEVQVGGDLYHAMTKLKHAYDLWNSNIFLIVAGSDVGKAQELLKGAFHEIQGKIRIIESDKIIELFNLKKTYRDLEAQLGILL